MAHRLLLLHIYREERLLPPGVNTDMEKINQIIERIRLSLTIKVSTWKLNI